jgi:dTDP-4-amino-4,6-dideoxygalactose transaminase
MILMNDFKSEPPEMREAMLQATSRVLESGRYVLGNEVKHFEEQWAKACGVDFGIGVGNGMDAIEIALNALGLSSEDEVISTSMTAFATILAIIRSGAKPVLADIDSETALLSIESVKRCLTAKTKAVVLVHLYGQLRKMDEWVIFCEENNIMLIEDCAQAHQATWQGKVAGNFGQAGAYSFYPTKNLGAVGDAGMLVTNNNTLAEKARQLRNYGQSERYLHPVTGMNSRLDEIQAAMLSERMKWLPEFTKRRRQIAGSYHSKIDNSLVKQLIKPEDRLSHVYHLFVITCPQRDRLQAHLLNKGVQALIHYPVTVQQQKPCSELARDPNGLQNSEIHASMCLSLPCHPQMSNTDIECVIESVNSFKGE